MIDYLTVRLTADGREIKTWTLQGFWEDFRFYLYRTPEPWTIKPKYLGSKLELSTRVHGSIIDELTSSRELNVPIPAELSQSVVITFNNPYFSILTGQKLDTL